MENLNQFKSSTSDPMGSQFTEADITAMLAAPSSAEPQLTLMPRGGTSQIQGQNLSRGYDLFSQVFRKENSPMHPLGISNEYPAGSNQVTLKATERPLQNDATANSNRAWNPMWFQQNQLPAVDANVSQYQQNYMQYAPAAYNPNNQSQVAVQHVHGDQLFGPGQFPRVEQSLTLQMRQDAPADANNSTIFLQKATAPELPPPRAHFPNLLGNQNAKGTASSADQRKSLIAMQNQAQTLLGRGRPWDALETGEGSSAKRQKPANSPSNQGPNAGPALQGPNNAPENPRLLDLINSAGTNSNSLYDPAYETLGLPVDPHLKLFQALAARGEKGYRMYD